MATTVSLFTAAILIAMTLIALIFAIARRKERALPWLVAIGASWSLDNLMQLFASGSRDWLATWNSASAGTILTIYALAGFAVMQFGIKPATRWLASMAGIGAAAMAACYFANLTGYGSNSRAAITVVLAMSLSGLLVFRLRQVRNDLTIGTVVGLAVALCALIFDNLERAGILDGNEFRFSPYASIVAFSIFSFVIVRTFLRAMADREQLAEQLGKRIETTKANLLASESARRSLEVSSAITHERERMMREIHDGIGSSLIAAIASAERQGRQTTTAIVALKSALTDLRIAVDSLEPVEGNVATLLASLRYRLEPEMRKSGISIDWRVGDVPELDWLDAPNALHVLRIFQEAIGNILGHANARLIRVACKMELHEGRPGILIDVTDDGVGFDASVPPKGKGRRNMADRAEALDGKLWISSSPGAGTTTCLWLPLLRAKI